MSISKTARCILRDAIENGSVKLYPNAKSLIAKMVSDGLVTMVERGGMLVVKATRKGKAA